MPPHLSLARPRVLFCTLVLIRDEAENDVVTDLQRVDVQETLRRGDERKVDSMRQRPELPARSDAGPRVVLDLCLDLLSAPSFRNSEVREEDDREDWRPQYLVDGDLGRDLYDTCTRNQTVQEPIEVMSRRPMKEESERGHPCQTCGIQVLDLAHVLLRQKVAREESDEGRQGLCEDRLVGQVTIVPIPQTCEDVSATSSSASALASPARTAFVPAARPGVIPTESVTAAGPEVASPRARAKLSVRASASSVAKGHAHGHDAGLRG